jgi:hypothetical protein
MGHAARSLYETRFDWPVMVDRLLRMLDSQQVRWAP